MLVAAIAIIAATTAGGIGALFYNLDKTEDKKPENRTPYEPYATSSQEWSVYL